MSSHDLLKWTGERFIPSEGGTQIAYEHFTRYYFADLFSKNKKILDIGFGEGYGTYLLAKNAKNIVGIEISKDATTHAKNQYKSENIQYIRASATNLPLKKSFNLVTCFEIFEHLNEEHQLMLFDEIERTLEDDGILLISTPNKKLYSDDINYNNPFHIHEIYSDEFLNILHKKFSHVFLFGQHLLSGSYINIIKPSPPSLSVTEKIFYLKEGNPIEIDSNKLDEFLYFIAICTNKKELKVPSQFLLVDHKRTLIDELANNIGQLLKEKSENNILIHKLQDQNSTLISELKSVKEHKSTLASELESVKVQNSTLISELKSVKEHKSTLASELESVKAQNSTLISELKSVKEHKSTLASELESVKAQNSTLISERDLIYKSKSWKIITLYRKLMGNFIVELFRKMYRSSYRIGKLVLPINLKIFIKKRILKNYYEQQLNLSDPTENTSMDKKTEIKEGPTRLMLNTQKKELSKFDVLFFPIIDWDFRYQRPQHLASQFAENCYRVFYFKTRFSNQDIRITREIKDRVYEVQLFGDEKINIYTDFLSEENIEQIYSSIDRFRRENNIIGAICFVQLPFWTPLTIKLKEEFNWKVVYDCMDEHRGFSINTDDMLSQENILSKESDIIITTSNKLFDCKKYKNKNCILSPNAGEFENFHRNPGTRPPDIENIKQPIVGYYGAISDWFDDELVRYLAIKKPNWNFVLIGHTFGSNIAELKKCSNVYFLGEKPYKELPSYLYCFNVCIIPFKINILTEATNPVKVYEFFSAGKPVVSVKLPELKPFSNLLYLADDKVEFLGKVEEALKENDEEKVKARIEFARENTWEDRFLQIEDSIKSNFKNASIIIVTYNNLDLTKKCIKSIYKNTIYPSFEVIIVDNNSTDGTKEYLRDIGQKYDNIKLILNDKNEGFARANNKGYEVSKGDYIVLLNNDTVVTRGWLTKLIKYLDLNKEIGLVGPSTNYIGNEAKIDVTYKSLNEIEEFAERYTRDNDGKYFEIKVLAMFCVAMKRELIEEIGFLDERFSIGMFEDDDFAIRVKQKGYKSICVEDVFVHHEGNASFKKLDRDEYIRIFERNRKKFEEKWGITWEPHRYRDQD